MTNTEILEELYGRLPNAEADALIDLILSGEPSGVSRAEKFLNGEEETKHQYNLFQGIREKPIYKTVNRFMNGELQGSVQILKMLSSVLTQMFIQCELRGLNPKIFEVGKVTDLINQIVYSKDAESLEEELKNLLIGLGFSETVN